MCNSKNKNDAASYLIEDRVWEMPQNTTMGTVIVPLPLSRGIRQLVDTVENLTAKELRSLGITLGVPLKGRRYLCLSVRQDLNFKQAHSELSLALASAHDKGTIVPSRRPARRRRISCLQDSDKLASSLPSRLSSSATTSADRSSVGNESASSKRWSMRAFIGRESSTCQSLGSIQHAGTPTLRFKLEVQHSDRRRYLLGGCFIPQSPARAIV